MIEYIIILYKFSPRGRYPSFIEADIAYNAMKLYTYDIPPVDPDEIARQKLEAVDKYLQLPINSESKCFMCFYLFILIAINNTFYVL